MHRVREAKIKKRKQNHERQVKVQIATHKVSGFNAASPTTGYNAMYAQPSEQETKPDVAQPSQQPTPPDTDDDLDGLFGDEPTEATTQEKNDEHEQEDDEYCETLWDPPVEQDYADLEPCHPQYYKLSPYLASEPAWANICKNCCEAERVGEKAYCAITLR